MPINPNHPANLPAGPKPMNDHSPASTGSGSASTNPVTASETAPATKINDGFDAQPTAAVSNHENAVLTTETGLHPSAIALNNGSAIVNTRVLASNWKEQPPRTDLSGLSITGLNLSDVQSGKLNIHFPLRKGTFAIPTSHADAETDIERDGQVQVNLKISSDPHGQPIINTAGIHFDPQLTVLNPASALQPSEGFMGPVLDWVQDIAGDVQISDLSIDAHGQVIVSGKIIRPWPLDDQDLAKHIPAGTFPVLNMGLQSAADGQLIRTEAQAQSGESPSIKDLLSALGALTGRGQFQVQLHGRDTSLGIDGEGLHMHSTKSPIDLDIKGSVDLDDDGNLRFTLPSDPKPEVKTGAGELDLAGHIQLRARNNGQFAANGALRSRINFGHIEGQSKFRNISTLPFVINDPDNVVIGKTIINFDKNKLHIGRGQVHSVLHASLEEGAQINVDGNQIDLFGGELVSDGDLHFFTNDDGISVNDGFINLKLSSKDAALHRGHSKISVNGAAHVDVHAERLRIDAHEHSGQGEGRLRFRLSPDGFTDQDTPFWGDVHYQLLPDGRLRLKPGDDGLTQFAQPFSATAIGNKTIVDPETPAVGEIGSLALRQHLAKLCDSPLRTEAEPRLLVDGIQSRAARLKMIRSAKKSIALQTLIFKDDLSGHEMADELIAAAKRGVEVRVIIDAVGNLQKFSELGEEKPLYKRLREGGVELALYNDPRSSNLGQLLDLVAHNPELKPDGDLDSLLQDPMLALDFMQKLSRFADGGGQLNDATRLALKQALAAAVGESEVQALSVDTAELSAASQANKGNLGQILNALRLAASLNNRWHEKYLVVDAKQAITGGMNIADEYLLGGTGQKVLRDGVERSAWRDTDVQFKGEAARDALRDFSRNWNFVTGQSMPLPALASPAPDAVHNSDLFNNNNSLNNNPQMQIIQHRPHIDGDHHIVNFMIENLKALKKGQKAYISNAYFLPTGALQNYKQALIDAAERGVDVRILTNSEHSTDLPQINQAALESYLDLLKAGVRIFERKGERTMHTKAAVFGSNTGAVGSWNTDNRSASLNSEHLAVTYDPSFAKKLGACREKSTFRDRQI